MAQLINIANVDEIKSNLSHYEDGQVFYCEENAKCYIKYQEEIFETTAGDLNMKLYEINRMIFEQLPAIDNLLNVDGLLDEFKELLDINCNKYYMLYGKEISYFTLFNYTSDNAGRFLVILEECLNNIGKIKDFCFYEDNKIEIWVTLEEEGEIFTTCMYFFPYDMGVEEV